ncbi:MAG: biotin/lipoyl-binding protein [Kovacikia sp.]
MTMNSLEPLQPPTRSDSSDGALTVPAAPKRRFIRWISGSLLLALLGGGGYVISQQLGSKAELSTDQRPKVVPVERMDLAITVSANGIVEPEQVVNVSPKTAGILTQLLVKEGDSVTQGQAIARMDDSSLQGQLTQAQGQLAKARADLEKALAGNRTEEIAQAKARVISAQAEANQTAADLRRNQSLYEAGAISQQTYEKARTANATAQANLAEVQQALALSQAGSRTEEIAAARAQARSALGTLETIQSQINDTIIRAAFNGTVSRKYADPGAFVTPTTAGSSVSSATSSSILALASTNRVVANVSETSIAKIRIGQTATITADAYPGKTFRGKVSQIATQAIVQQNVTSFEVKVALDPIAAKQLRSGMNVSVKFNVGSVTQAMTIPTIAVNRENNVTGVYVGAPDQPPRFIPITTGTTLNDRTEVKSGLTGTEHILLQAPPKLKPKSGFSLPNFLGGSGKDGPPGQPPGGGPPQGRPPQGGSPQGGPPGG